MTAPVQVKLKGGGSGTFTVPLGVTSLLIEAIGAGGAAAAGPGGQRVGGMGGGGGQYSTRTLAVTPGQIISWQVGQTGTANDLVGGQPLSPKPCDTWFGAPTTLFAQGGGDGNHGGFSEGGTFSPVGWPWTSFSGGGCFAAADDNGSSGGGAAGGPNGKGGEGGSPHPFPGSGGGGGGGANGGVDGDEAFFGDGGAGGANRFGLGGGAGGLDPTESGGPGANGGGGGGGRGLNSTTFGNGGDGSQDAVWGVDGPGGGGGGSGYSGGGAGGGFGGDTGVTSGGDATGWGGAGGGCQTGGTPGASKDGIIVLTYTPGAPPPELYCVPFVVGATYPSRCQILRPASPQESQTQSGPAQGKLRRMTYAAPLLFEAQGVSMGVDFLNMRPLAFKSAGGTVDLTVQQLFSGVYWQTVDADYNYDNMWCWQITRPYPCTVVSVECQVETNENL